MTGTAPVVVANPAFAHGPGVTIRIPVFFHIITGTGGVGNVTRAQIVQQVAVLNSSFAIAGIYSFELAGISRVENNTWFTTIKYQGSYADGAPERDAKQTLAQDPRHVLNIYTADLVGGSGFATLPFTFSYPTQASVPYDEDYYLNGVMADHTTMPNGTHPTYNEGDLVVHEVGHYLGLYHPNNGACTGNTESTCSEEGDGVCDTPQVRELSYDSTRVNAPGTVCDGMVDDTRSFMNYTEDSYKIRFTGGQHERMDFVGGGNGSAGRPSLGQPAAPERVSAGVAVTFEPGVTFRYGTGETLTVAGTLVAAGATLTSTSSTANWYGLRVTGGTATLSGGTTVEYVDGQSTNFAPPVAASVIVSGGGHVVLDGATLRKSNGGLLVSGQGSTGSVLGETLVTDNAGRAGILATAGGFVTVASNSAVITGNAEGVAATGSGSRVLVTAAQVIDNDGPAVRAAGGGRVDVLRYTGDTPPATLPLPVRMESNIGGLYAVATGKTGGGVVFTGERFYECDPFSCPDPSVGNHNFRFNNSGSAFDITSRGGSVAFVPENYWGVDSVADTTLIERDRDAASTLVYLPIRTTVASLTGGGAPASRGVAGGTVQSAVDESAPVARASQDVLTLIGRAEGRVQAGAADDAADLLLGAWALAGSDDDRLAVSEAAGRALGVAEPADLVAWTATAGAWGTRARAAGLAAQGQTAEAAALASALAATPGTGDVAESHRIRGLSLRVETAVASGDAATAVSALSNLADADPEGAADLAVSVALAFPDAGVVAGRGIAPARGSVPTADAGKAEGGPALAFGPNPASGTVRIVLSTAEDSQAEIVVYDALGRRVALLHDGPAAGGTTATFDGASFPVGLYVVRAVVRGASGTAVLTRTVTVAR